MKKINGREILNQKKARLRIPVFPRKVREECSQGQRVVSCEEEKASVSHGPTLIGQKTPVESRNSPFPSMSRLQHPAPLPSTVSWCFLKLTSLESVMPSAYISLLQKLTLVSSVTSISCFFSTPVTSASLYYFNPNGFLFLHLCSFSSLS